MFIIISNMKPFRSMFGPKLGWQNNFLLKVRTDLVWTNGHIIVVNDPSLEKCLERSEYSIEELRGVYNIYFKKRDYICW